MTDLALAIARSHCDWARGEGHSPQMVCRAVGTEAASYARWREAELALALAWIEMQKRTQQ